MPEPQPLPPSLADFHAALQRSAGRWFGACLRLMGDAGRAEDAVQEALLKAWAQREGFRQEAGLDTWIHRIALNVALDQLRRQAPEAVDPEQLDAHASPHAGPEEQATQRALGRDLDGALACLSARERESFVLKHLEGCSLADIAERQGCSTNNAKQTLFRAVRKLRVELIAWRAT